ncbi:MAG: hypothetical protein ACM3VZ_00465 [Acidobacteriota bacterium]
MAERYELIGASTLTGVDMTVRKDVFASLFDEQLQILDSLGKPFPFVSYVVALENGRFVEGVTNAEGKTERVSTGRPVGIKSIELHPKPRMCCALHLGRLNLACDSLVIPLQDIQTNSDDVGESVRQVETPKGGERNLTSGEIAMAKSVFGEGIDYRSVKVHRGGYWLFFGFQDEDTAVTPNGEMYFPGRHFKEDYSLESVGDQGWFIHEMTHVWQYQRGYWVKLIRGPRPNMKYAYTLGKGARFCDFNMEAQGNIAEDYYLVVVKGAQRLMRESKYRNDPRASSLLTAVLQDFLQNPKDQEHLPKTTE